MIPKELTELDRWVCVKNGSKIPFQALTDYPASSTNPATWSEYIVAQNMVDIGFYDYVGFVFNGDGYIGIDVDAGTDEDGNLNDLAKELIELCKSYTEWSKSGRGIHIILKGTLPFPGANNRQGIEIYSTARYFITTGKNIENYPVVANQKAIDEIINKYFPMTRESKEKKGDTFYKFDYPLPHPKKVGLKPKYPEIKQGCRNVSLLSLAGQLWTNGYSSKEIYRELLRCNSSACNPPLPMYEVQSIVKSVVKYKK